MKAKVFHVITKLELGGAQKVTLMTLERLPRDRYELCLITAPDGLLVEWANRIPSLTRLWIPNLVRTVQPIQDSIALFKLWQLFRRERPDIVHTHCAKAGILGRWAAKLAGVPIIFHTYHGLGFNDVQGRIIKNFYVLLERLTGKWTTQPVIVSRANADVAEKSRIVQKDKWILCRDAISVQEFMQPGPHRTNLREWNIPENRIVIGMVSCFKARKAPIDFVDIAARVLKETTRDVHFIMAGDGELRPAIEARIRDLAIDGHITLLGWQKDMPQVYRNLDIVVLTSLWEGLPCVFSEAMAGELPIVATDVDGAREAIIDGENGFLHRPHDIEGMAKSVVKLVEDPALRKEMGRRGKSRVMEFDISTSVAALESAYRQRLAEQ